MRASSQRPRRTTLVILLLAASVLVVLELVKLALGLDEQEDTSNWVPVACEVLEVKTQERRRGDQTLYYMRAVFEYEYDGRIRRTGRWALDQPVFFSRYEHGRDWFLSRHPPGKTLECHVDPDDPEQAVVVAREAKPQSRTRLIVPVLWLFLILLVLIRELRLLNEPPERHYPRTRSGSVSEERQERRS